MLLFIIGISFNDSNIMLIPERRLEGVLFGFVEKKELIDNFEKNTQNR
jgi:hypothetical protein